METTLTSILFSLISGIVIGFTTGLFIRKKREKIEKELQKFIDKECTKQNSKV